MGTAIVAVPFVLLAFLPFLPWLALLAMPLAIWMASAALLASGAARLLAEGRTIEALQPRLLALIGLEREPRLEGLVRGTIERVLGYSPAGTRAAACACVKPSGQSYVGVLRIWNNRGQYQLRTPGESLAAVANGMTEQLLGFGDRFPAREGTARVRIHECDPRTCPLRKKRAIARLQTA